MMDHEQAIEMQASLRYALGELSPAERDSFEEHFADCSRCMTDVELAATFAANAAEVFRTRSLPGSRPKDHRVWLGWRPIPVLALSAALNVLLVAGIGLGFLWRAPAAPGRPASLEAQSVEVVPVHGATRSADGPQVVRASRQPLVLSFDLPQRYEHYFYVIERGGSTVLSGELTVAGRSDSLNIQIPVGRLAGGEYRVTAMAASGAARENLGTCLLQVPAQ
jgi:Putative zinc-finger